MINGELDFANLVSRLNGLENLFVVAQFVGFHGVLIAEPDG